MAQGLTAKENPLTARVAANRIWLHLFGQGLVRSADNFGSLGETPTHPELLDYLATSVSCRQRLVHPKADQGTSCWPGILISSSSAFITKRYHHKLDPDSMYLWRMPVRRLEAEAIRDAVPARQRQAETASRFKGTML